MDFFCFYLLQCTFLQRKASQKHYWVCFALYWLIYQVVLAFPLGAWEKLAFGAISFTGFSLLTHKGAWYSLAAATEKLQESSLLNQQTELLHSQLHALEQSNRAQRDLTHDFHNHLQVILGLLKADEIEKAQAVIAELLGGPTARIFAVRTSNPILDALLNQKYLEAKAQKVDMQLRVNNLSELPLPEDLMVTLLSNLLDNAIEGCLRTDGYKEVLVTLVKEEDTVFLAVRNPSLPVEVRNGLCETSKPDKANHGFGLGKISTILNRLHAFYSIRCADGYFSVAAELPLTPPKEKKPRWWQFRKRWQRRQDKSA